MKRCEVGRYFVYANYTVTFKTQLWKSGIRILNSLFMLKKNVCSLYRLKVSNIVKLEAILFMLI